MDKNLVSQVMNNGEGDMDKTIDHIVEEKNTNTEDNTLKQENDDNTVLGSAEYSKIQPTDDIDQDLKNRIANCKEIIESLKLELIEEKAKLQEESIYPETVLSNPSTVNSADCYTNDVSSSIKFVVDTHPRSDIDYLYNSSVDTKLFYNESLIEYEKQLQRYQDTLAMAQAEKKKAMRKKMLVKTFKLKLLEVENQIKIEVLRVKQSLQCVDSLQMILNKWKDDDNESTCDLDSYELLPRYPLPNRINDSSNALNIFTDDEKSELVTLQEET